MSSGEPGMDGGLEDRLRAALRRESPSAAFTESLLARLQSADQPDAAESATPQSSPARAAGQSVPARARARSAASYWRLGLAAGVVLAAGIAWQLHRQQIRGNEAKAQLLQALAVTSHSLDRAWQAVNAGGDGG